MERKHQNSFFKKNNPLKKSNHEIPIENSFGNYVFNNITLFIINWFLRLKIYLKIKKKQ